MIPKETIDKILDTARIEEVVGEYITLKKRGANLLGLCPFHNEKTPSFTVSPVKGIYKCFGCGKAGNAVGFIMDHDHLTYPDALRFLAKKYSIEIEEEQFTPEKQQEQNEKESVYVACSFAQKHFTENLLNTEEGRNIGLSYFRERGFRNDIIEKFQLGYSLDEWRGFSDTALKIGYKLEYLVRAGLTIVPDEYKNLIKQYDEDPKKAEIKFFDRFSGRVIFPVHDKSGRVIAFGGRTLKIDKKIAKYINSPETEIYHKSNVLYGLFFARKSIKALDVCLLVEGYTDVISLCQAGIENTVASSGTSLTEEQIRQVMLFTHNLTILYDGDPAGIKASFRGINLILEKGMNVKVLLFPDGEDPDSYSKKVSPDELKEFIKKNSVDFITFKTNLLFKEAKEDPVKKTELGRDIVEIISLIPDAIIREEYVKTCSRIIEVDEQRLHFEINKIRRRKFFDKKESEFSTADGPKPEPPDTVQPLLPDIFTSDFEALEKKIIQLLLVQGHKQIVSEITNEEGLVEEINISIAELIHHELEHDQIVMENPLYRLIYEEYMSKLNTDTPADDQYFIRHPDPDISRFSAELISFPYTLAPWMEKVGIMVETEEMNLKKVVYNVIYSLKSKKVEALLNENQKKLKDLVEFEDVQNLQQDILKLLDAKKHFNSLLGRIVIK